MAVCCCSLAGTAACQHCSQNPFATDVWTNKTVTVAHFNKKPNNADRIRAMSDDELADFLCKVAYNATPVGYYHIEGWLEWLKEEARDGREVRT